MRVSIRLFGAFRQLQEQETLDLDCPPARRQSQMSAPRWRPMRARTGKVSSEWSEGYSLRLDNTPERIL